MNTNKIDLITDDVSSLLVSDHLTEQRDLNNTSEEMESESEGSDTTKSSSENLEIMDSYSERLERYLKENSSIGPTEAKNRLHEEIGFEMSLQNISRLLKKMRKEMGLEYFNLRSYNSGIRYKLNDSHIKCLKRYLSENNFIGPTEARNKLHEETGLEVSIYPIQKALIRLKEEIDPEYSKLLSSNSVSATRRGVLSRFYKLKDSHIEFLKKCLREKSHIGPTEVKKRLQDETGLELSISYVQRALIKLREEIDPGNAKLRLSKIKSSQSNYFKIKGLHIECLKKYLKEGYISGIEAKKRLQQETGLEVGIPTVQKALVKLREESDPEYAKWRSSKPISKVKSKKSNHTIKIKDSHIECLKRCLMEKSSIGPTEAMNRLHKETGLKVGTQTVKRYLVKLKEEINPFKKTPGRSYKLKDSHIRHLKKYLRENINIGNTEARKRLYNETGLEVSTKPVKKVLTELKKQISLKKTPRDRHKLKKFHMECLKKYLHENKSITIFEATKRLHKETGLNVSILPVQKALIKLKRINLENKVGGQYKLKDFHVECLKNYLRERSSIGPTEANKRLQEETGIEVSIMTVRKALVDLRKQINLENLKKGPIADYNLLL